MDATFICQLNTISSFFSDHTKSNTGSNSYLTLSPKPTEYLTIAKPQTWPIPTSHTPFHSCKFQVPQCEVNWVGVNIIIIQKYFTTTLLYCTQVRHLLQSQQKKHCSWAPIRDMAPNLFWLCRFSPNLKLELIQMNPMGSSK